MLGYKWIVLTRGKRSWSKEMTQIIWQKVMKIYLFSKIWTTLYFIVATEFMSDGKLSPKPMPVPATPKEASQVNLNSTLEQNLIFWWIETHFA